MPVTHAPETGTRKLASVSGAGFPRHAVANFLAPETNMDE